MSKKILLIDHQDSFTMNIAGMLSAFGADVWVLPSGPERVDVAAFQPDGIILSPGPGHPESAVNSLDLIRKHAGEIPMLGVCLGHQMIGTVFGAKVVAAIRPVHGYTSQVFHTGDALFQGLPNPCIMMRYHSLVIAKTGFPDSLDEIARADSGEIMAIRHKRYNLAGVQFHPESIGSIHGGRILENWLDSL